MSVTVDLQELHIVRLMLERPEKHNALDGPMVHELIGAMDKIADMPGVRLLQIAAAGRHFCAGADIGWMQKMAASSERDNEADARELATLFKRIDTMPMPVMALVQGAVYGGGMGIVSASDIVIAADDAIFGFPETRIGLCPSVVSPWVTAILGNRLAQYYFLTGDTLTAADAVRLGLVHQVVPAAELVTAGNVTAKKILAASPSATAETRRLVRLLATLPAEQFAEMTAKHLARMRRSADAREGLAARLEKRPPVWGK